MKLLLLISVLSLIHLPAKVAAEDGAASPTVVGRKAGDVYKNSIGMELIYCPPGRFRMGGPKDPIATKRDEREVDVELTKPFYLGKYEVTRRDWSLIMDSAPWERGINKKQGEKYPVADIRWKQAVEFCDKLSKREGNTYRLPTEAEWEYACRAGTTTQYYFGDKSKLEDHAWFAMNTEEVGERFVHMVGLKQPNPWGFHDVYGNVFELCWDSYAEKAPGGRDPKFRSGKKFDNLVMKGGCCSSFSDNCRSPEREPNDEFTKRWTIGFRVCLEVGEPNTDKRREADASPQKYTTEAST